MSLIPQSADFAASLTAQSTLDTASEWASAHPTIILAVAGSMLAVTAVTAAIRALRRYLRLALLMLVLSSVPAYPTAAHQPDLPPPIAPSLLR